MEESNIDNTIEIVYFRSESPAGDELLNMVAETLHKKIVCGKKINIALGHNTVESSLQACVCYDIVIFDATVETGENSHYEAASELLKSTDHVLVVGRTRLPHNFRGLRKGGYPGYIKTGITDYQDSLSNEKIVNWICKKVEDIARDIPRMTKLTVNQLINPNDVLHTAQSIVFESLEKYKQPTGAFISYTSKHSRYVQNTTYTENICVEDLCEYISNNSHFSKEHIGYFPPGAISRELMTEQRRWEFVSIAYDFIQTSKEFWILDTPDYWNSWWTYGERVAMRNILDNDGSCPDIYIAVPNLARDNKTFHITAYKTHTEKNNFLPKPSEVQKKQLARFWSNSNLNSVGYETIENMRQKSELSRTQLYLEYLILKKALHHNPAMVGRLDYISQKSFEHFDDYYESVHSYVYSDDFWNTYILECPNCKNNEKKDIDFDAFLNTSQSHIKRINKDTYSKILDTKTYVCETCEKSFHFKEGAYAIWWPIRKNKRTGPNGEVIQKKKCLYFVD